jgi:hypothetical protein
MPGRLQLVIAAQDEHPAAHHRPPEPSFYYTPLSPDGSKILYTDAHCACG